jgi:hypothetical protein
MISFIIFIIGVLAVASILVATRREMRNTRVEGAFYCSWWWKWIVFKFR